MSQYSIQVTRWGDDEEATILVDQYITADQAIDAMVFAQGLEVIEEEDEEPEVEEEVVEVEEVIDVKDKPEQPVRQSKRGKRGTYDRAALEGDIIAGELTNKQLMEKYDISAPTVSRVKAMLRPDQKLPTDGNPGETAYMAKRREREAVPAPETNVEAEIKLAFVQGFTLAEVSPMFPLVEMSRLVELKAEATR